MSSRLPSIYHTLTPPRNYNLENLEFLSQTSLPIPRSAPIPLLHTKKTAEAVLFLSFTLNFLPHRLHRQPPTLSIPPVSPQLPFLSLPDGYPRIPDLLPFVSARAPDRPQPVPVLLLQALSFPEIIKTSPVFLDLYNSPPICEMQRAPLKTTALFAFHNSHIY